MWLSFVLNVKRSLKEPNKIKKRNKISNAEMLMETVFSFMWSSKTSIKMTPHDRQWMQSTFHLYNNNEKHSIYTDVSLNQLFYTYYFHIWISSSKPDSCHSSLFNWKWREKKTRRTPYQLATCLDLKRTWNYAKPEEKNESVVCDRYIDEII